MSGERAKKRTAPLLGYRERMLNERRAAFAGAAGAASAAAAAAASARKAWETQAARVATTPYATVADHADAHAHVDHLWKAVLRAAEAAADAGRKERAAREALLAAERELKKIETWRDRLVEAEQAEAARVERGATDELAARMHARGRTGR